MIRFLLLLYLHQNDIDYDGTTWPNNLITYGKEYNNEDAREDLPVMDAAEGFFICDVIHKNESHSTAVVSSCNRSIPFLPRRVLHIRMNTHQGMKEG